ncbi:hypothetical protein [Thalassotalea litorea]|uniref:hypothetical protein n=1 Tax=Thalassotalea litorea TaxID=2020715 RepID=UPI0037358484
MDLKQKIRNLIQSGYIEGELQVDPLWYILWKPEELEQFNLEYNFKDYAPEFIGFGDSGSNELLAVNNAGEIFTLPAIGMESRYAVKIANSFDELTKLMVKTN